VKTLEIVYRNMLSLFFCIKFKATFILYLNLSFTKLSSLLESSKQQRHTGNLFLFQFVTSV